MNKVYIETYGCQMNVADTEVVFSILGKAGFVRTDQIAQADVIMANTCSIRDNAEQRILGRIEQFNIYRKARPGVVTGILGCMAERLKEDLLKTGKVDIVAGPDSYRNLPLMIEGALSGQPQINVLLSREETYADIDPVRTDSNGVSAFISIMRGCNNVCSYCVVPYTRGAERSRDWKSIVREACGCFAGGYREITLLGQNVDSYSYGDMDFAGLLKTVAEAVPQMRIRFSTSNPQDISDEVLLTMASHPNICRHIHLPVQSGSDRILEKMRRRYSREWYLARVARIRELMPDCAISTDVIAGFCSETEEDHRQTLSLFEEVDPRRPQVSRRRGHSDQDPQAGGNHRASEPPVARKQPAGHRKGVHGARRGAVEEKPRRTLRPQPAEQDVRMAGHDPQARRLRESQGQGLHPGDPALRTRAVVRRFPRHAPPQRRRSSRRRPPHDP